MTLNLLLAIALIANCKNRHMLWLVAAVGSTLIAEPPDDYVGFYIFCIGAEMGVIIIAVLLRAEASTAVILICLGMITVHVSSYLLDGYPPLSPSRLIIPILEHAEIAACIILSNPLNGRIQSYDPSRI